MTLRICIDASLYCVTDNVSVGVFASHLRTEGITAQTGNGQPFRMGEPQNSIIGLTATIDALAFITVGGRDTQIYESLMPPDARLTVRRTSQGRVRGVAGRGLGRRHRDHRDPGAAPIFGRPVGGAH
jgi:hypothetical protein